MSKLNCFGVRLAICFYVVFFQNFTKGYKESDALYLFDFFCATKRLPQRDIVIF